MAVTFKNGLIDMNSLTVENIRSIPGTVDKASRNTIKEIKISDDVYIRVEVSRDGGRVAITLKDMALDEPLALSGNNDPKSVVGHLGAIKERYKPLFEAKKAAAKLRNARVDSYHIVGIQPNDEVVLYAVDGGKRMGFAIREEPDLARGKRGSFRHVSILPQKGVETPDNEAIEQFTAEQFLRDIAPKLNVAGVNFLREGKDGSLRLYKDTTGQVITKEEASAYLKDNLQSTASARDVLQKKVADAAQAAPAEPAKKAEQDRQQAHPAPGKPAAEESKPASKPKAKPEAGDKAGNTNADIPMVSNVRLRKFSDLPDGTELQLVVNRDANRGTSSHSGCWIRYHTPEGEYGCVELTNARGRPEGNVAPAALTELLKTESLPPNISVKDTFEIQRPTTSIAPGYELDPATGKFADTSSVGKAVKDAFEALKSKATAHPKTSMNTRDQNEGKAVFGGNTGAVVAENPMLMVRNLDTPAGERVPLSEVGRKTDLPQKVQDEVAAMFAGAREFGPSDYLLTPANQSPAKENNRTI